MQVRCYHCHKPYALGREALHAALDYVTAQELPHYNAACPHCRRVNRLSKQEMMHAAPDWVKQDQAREENLDEQHAPL
jgi:phage FluMu protein Com